MPSQPANKSSLPEAIQLDQWKTDSEALQRIREYNPLSSVTTCPLCRYMNGTLVTVCVYHKIIGALQAELRQAREDVEALDRRSRKGSFLDGVTLDG